MASRQLNAHLLVPVGTRPILCSAASISYRPNASISRSAGFSTAHVLRGRAPRVFKAHDHALRPRRFGKTLLDRKVEVLQEIDEPEKAGPKTRKHIWATAFRIPDYSTSLPIQLASSEVHGQFSPFVLKSSPEQPIEDALLSLFTKPAPTLHFSNPDFYHLRKNSRVPEVCIIGRSNVGKSSLVNAVANRTTGALARVSSKAGHTRTMNVYGFGPAPRPEKGEVELSDEFKGKEEMPAHQFFLVDMPGYGFGSREKWGKQISLYLEKRRNLKGAIMLIDGEVGPKQHDWDAVSLLAGFGVRTAFVLTKADKAKGGDEALLQTCKLVWAGIRRIEAQVAEQHKTWPWEREIYVTALASADKGTRQMTTTTARLAIARLAGLIEDTRPAAVKDPKWTGKTVSFEELFGGEQPETDEAAAEAWHEESDDLVYEEDVDERSGEHVTFEEIVATQNSLAWADEAAQREGQGLLPEHTSPAKLKEKVKLQRRDADSWRDNLINKRETKLSPSSEIARRAAIRLEKEREWEKSGVPAPYMKNSPNQPPRLAPKRGTPLPGRSNIAPKVYEAPKAPRPPLTPLQALTEASNKSGRLTRTRQDLPFPGASFFHTSARAHVREERTQPHPLSKEELHAVLLGFIETLQTEPTPRDQSRQRKQDMDRGVGQPDPEEMKATWAKRLEDNKKKLARRFGEQSDKVSGIIEARLKKEEQKLAKKASDDADKEIDWRAEQEQRRLLEKRLNGREFDRDEEEPFGDDDGIEGGDEYGDEVQNSRGDGLRRGFRPNDVRQPFAKKLTKKEKKALKAEKQTQEDIEADEPGAFADAFKDKLQQKKKSKSFGAPSF